MTYFRFKGRAPAIPPSPEWSNTDGADAIFMEPVSPDEVNDPDRETEPRPELGPNGEYIVPADPDLVLVGEMRTIPIEGGPVVTRPGDRIVIDVVSGRARVVRADENPEEERTP